MIDSRSLQSHSFFGGLPVEEIEKILPLMEQENYKTGEEIITENKPNDRISLIIEGKVEVLKGDILINVLEAGSVFGEMEVLDIMHSEATIKSATDVTVLSMSNRTLRAIYKDDLKSFSLVIMNLARELSRRLRKADQQLAALKK